MKTKIKKSQIFSMDIIIVTIIILVTIGFLIFGRINSLNNQNSSNSVVEQKSEEFSKKIIEDLEKSEIISADENIDIDKLKNLDYEELKNKLGIEQDFAIVLEKNNSLLKIEGESYCIGTDKISIDSQKCIN